MRYVIVLLNLSVLGFVVFHDKEKNTARKSVRWSLPDYENGSSTITKNTIDIIIELNKTTKSNVIIIVWSSDH